MAQGSGDPWWGWQDWWGSHDWQDYGHQQREWQHGYGDQWLDPGAQWKGGRRSQKGKQHGEPMFLPEHVFMVDIPINMHDMPAGWWDSMKALATEFGCKVSWRAKRRWSSEPIYTLTAMGQQGTQVLEEVLKAMFWDFPDIDDQKITAPHQQLAENATIVEHIVGGIVMEQAQLPSAGPLTLRSQSEQTQRRSNRQPVELVQSAPTADAGTRDKPEPDVPQTKLSGEVGGRGLTRSEKTEKSASAGVASASETHVDDSILSRGAVALRDLTAIEPQLPQIDLHTTYNPPNHEKRVAFCVTHLKRHAQLRSVLAINLALTWKYRKWITWFVVDFSERYEDDMQTFIFDNFLDVIAARHLRFFRCDGLPYWHSSVAKNAAHCAPHPRDFFALCCLDCDNVINVGFVEHVLHKAIPALDSAVSVVHYTAHTSNGTNGRILLTSDTFYKIGGYNEDRLPVGNQDNEIKLAAQMFGKALTIRDDGTLVGYAVKNVIGASAKDCVKAKMLNIDPKFRHLTFHQMDAMNREKMWTAKKNNDLIANKGAETIGLPVQELLAPHATELPDWGGDSEPEQCAPVAPAPVAPTLVAPAPVAPAPGAATLVAPTVQGTLGLTSAHRASGSTGAASSSQGRPEGMTVSAPAPQSERTGVKHKFALSTFGCEKLYMCHGNRRHVDVKRVYDITESWKGGAPRPVPDDVCQRAVLQASGIRPDLVFDCRVFYDPADHAATRNHIGTHHLILKEVVTHKMFLAWLRAAKTRICAVMTEGDAGRAFHFSFFCRAGEKRSVACAAIVGYILEQNGWEAAANTNHMCAVFWNRKTCGGLCTNCRHWRQDEGKTWLERAVSLWTRVDGPAGLA